MSHNWIQQSAIPGRFDRNLTSSALQYRGHAINFHISLLIIKFVCCSVKPVYGAQYPPLTEYEDFANGVNRTDSASNQHSNSGAKFQSYVERFVFNVFDCSM